MKKATRLEPVKDFDPNDGNRLVRLVRDGIVSPARHALPKSLLTSPPKTRKRASIVETLLDERRDGR